MVLCGGEGRSFITTPTSRDAAMPVTLNADDANMVGCIFHNANLTGVHFEDVNMRKAALQPCRGILCTIEPR